MRLFTTTLLAIAGMTLAGCANDPRFADVEAYVVPPAKDRGRIYFYNDLVSSGFLVIPKIHVNEQSVGACQPRGVFFLDVAPGTHEMHASNKSVHDQKRKEPSVFVTIAAGEERFVRCRINRGPLIGKSSAHFGDGVLELVATDEGRAKSRKLSFSGSAAQITSAE
ncbi:MAG: DUF2846 domain-containing protein [Rhodospirillaceae bacterium]|nr:DUF2846 domain-containing protein [Rhodospirillaceae bacterium]